VVKCRPPDNRDPRYEEMEACRGYLEAQLAAIRPHVVVTLGRVAGCALTGQDLTMGRMRGRWFDVAGIPLLPTYHPSYLLRQRDAEGGKTKADRAVWEDLQAVQRRLERPPEA
jgi:DNA polymerase